MPQITQSITIKKSPAKVYELISQPKQMTKWFCNTAEAIDKGFTVGWTMPDGNSISFDATVIEDKPNERFVYRTIEEQSTLTTFELEAIDGGTQVTLTECCFEDTEADKARMEEHRQGWELFLSQMQHLGEEELT